MTDRGDTGLSKAPAHGVTETGRQEESHRNYVEGIHRNEGLKRRQAQRRKIARAQELYPEGDVSKERYLIIKENAEAELATIHVPELDDAAKAVKVLTDLNELLESVDRGQPNCLLLAVFHRIYVDLENREVVGFRPMKSFHALIQAMDYREDAEGWLTPYGEFTRDGGPPKPWIRGNAWEASATVPSVTASLAGIPWESTARCSLLFSPLWCGQWTDFRPEPQRDGDGP